MACRSLGAPAGALLQRQGAGWGGGFKTVIDGAQAAKEKGSAFANYRYEGNPFNALRLASESQPAAAPCRRAQA